MPDHDDMVEALWRIKQWSEAYPLDIFPEADLEADRRKLGDTEFSRLHASWARHLTDGIGKIARDALAETPPTEATT